MVTIEWQVGDHDFNPNAICLIARRLFQMLPHIQRYTLFDTFLTELIGPEAYRQVNSSLESRPSPVKDNTKGDFQIGYELPISS